MLFFVNFYTIFLYNWKKSSIFAAEMESKESNSIFQHPLYVSLFALTAAIAWGWAYPLIKLGFVEFGISADMTGSKVLFAGIRFFLSGLIILTVAKYRGLSFAVRDRLSWGYILLFALLNTTIHYACFYFGLSHSPGARAAILNSLSVFSVVVFSCLFFRSDRMTLNRILGCILGFAGILILNLGGGDMGHNGTFREWMLGDGFIIINALCSALASLMTRGLGARVNVFVGTGYSLALGGALLIVPGLMMGGYFPQIGWAGVGILLLLIGISTMGFTLYNKLLTCNPVGKVAIYNSLIPVVGAITSCLCLNEPFYWKYVLAVVLAAGGIYLINKRDDNR